MLDTRWQKVLIDLWQNRVRTLIVALAIAVGVYAVGVVLDTREILVREYQSDQAGALPASAVLTTLPFDDDLALRISELPGVAAAEGRSLVRARALGSDGKARDLVLVALPDLADQAVDRLTPLASLEALPGASGGRELVLERLALDFLGVRLGEEVVFELDDGTQKRLTVAGTVHDAQQVSPGISGTATGYVSPETMERLGLSAAYAELRVRIPGRPRDEAAIAAVVDRVQERLERSGRPLLAQRAITHSAADPFIDTVVLILTAFGAIILLLSGFLVVNAMSALIAQQVPQIGIMKLIGARRRQIVGLYLVTVLAYGLLAVALALPLAMLTARLLMTGMVNGLLNVMPESYAVPLPLLAVQAAVGLLLPLGAGLAPVLRGTRITTQRALNDVGVHGGQARPGLADRLLAAVQRVRRVQRPVLLALRNTLRHKGRLAQTLVVLTLGTALFVSVLSVRASVTATLEGFMRFHRYDVALDLLQPERAARLEQAALALPGVAAVEARSTGGAARSLPGGEAGDGFRLVAVPQGSSFLDPELLAGRWPFGGAEPAPANALVINSDLADDWPGVGVGSAVELEVAGRQGTWRVAGIVPTESRGPAAYVSLDDYAYASGTAGRANQVLVRTARHSAEAQQQAAARLFEQLEAQGIQVAGTQTAQAIRAENNLMFTIVVAFLVLMALLLAAVGGLGLTSTMSINVMERVREIGVLRAVGASNGSVRRIVLAEGMAMGLVSWVAGTLLSLVLSPLLSEQLGIALLEVPFLYHYAWAAAAAWLLVLQGVAVAASLGPARKAVRLTVREVLAYE